jgi:electron transfer flavoprotein beta subunit
MRTVVLLSAGRHLVSGRPCLPRLDAQAIRLARSLGPEPRGLHAGPGAEPVAEALGQGLQALDLLQVTAADDPLPSLQARLAAERPDLVLAGTRGQGGEDSGLLPYALAHALGLPLVPDAVALAPGPEPGTLVVEQALPKGARRRVTVRLPAVFTVPPAAPAPLPFAYGQARRGTVRLLDGVPAPRPDGAVEERPYRKRPKVMRATGGTAAERLAAATGAATSGGRVLVDPPPDVAAREILGFLREIGVLRR